MERSFGGQFSSSWYQRVKMTGPPSSHNLLYVHVSPVYVTGRRSYVKCISVNCTLILEIAIGDKLDFETIRM